MRGEHGYTLVEVILAAAILLVITGTVVSLLHDGLLHAPVLEEASDLQQRTRIAVEALASDIRAAGAGVEAGPLSWFVAPVLPRHATASAVVAVPDQITVRYVPAGGARSRLSRSLAPGDGLALLEPGGPCVRNAVACGFTTGSTAILFDESGQADLVKVLAIDPGVITIADARDPRAATYEAGAYVAEAMEISYAFDAARRQLRRDEGGGSFPVAENVVDLSFEYFGLADHPSMPRPPEGVSNCLYDSEGIRLPLSPPPGSGTLVPISLASLADGPFCGTGASAYDLDLLRLRSVRTVVRLETSVDTLRGTDARFFARPGKATGVKALPDSLVVFETALRNTGR